MQSLSWFDALPPVLMGRKVCWGRRSVRNMQRVSIEISGRTPFAQVYKKKKKKKKTLLPRSGVVPNERVKRQGQELREGWWSRERRPISSVREYPVEHSPVRPVRVEEEAREGRGVEARPTAGVKQALGKGKPKRGSGGRFA
jgi:hypothetical protein